MRIAIATGILYKFNKYSDRAAIAFAYTKEFGNIKLFVPSIANNSNVLVRHIPGTIHFHHKPNSDLHRLITFHEDLSYVHYLDAPEIYTRLSMVFELIHYAYAYDYALSQMSMAGSNADGDRDSGSGNIHNVLWYLLNRYQGDNDNAAKLTLYIVFTILNRSGYMFATGECTSCGEALLGDKTIATETIGDGTTPYASINADGETLCTRCTPQIHTITSSEISGTTIKYMHPSVVLALQCFHSSEHYKALEVGSVLEHELLSVLFFHASNVLNHRLNAYNHYRLIMPPTTNV